VQRYEIEAWLGDDHGLSAEQVDQLAAAAAEIGRRYPDPDDADEREAALTVAYRLMVEDHDGLLAELGAELLRARLAESRVLAGIRQCAVTLVQGNGRGARGLASEAGFARAAGVDRMAVRSWLDKR
jgi:hypothetical protein